MSYEYCEQPLIIDPEFKALIPPLTPEEYAQLEANILADGCRDPLVVWEPEFNGDVILLDGHNRHEICKKHNYEFLTNRLTLKDIPDRQAAINWIINNQLGRRNLHPDQASYLRGKRYNGEKQAHGADRKSEQAKSRSQNDFLIKTYDRLATEYQVGPKTIQRDGQFAEAVDKLAGVGIDPQTVIAHADKADVIEVAKAIVAPEPEPESPLFLETPAAKPVAPPIIRQTVEALKAHAPVKETLKAAAKDLKTIPSQTLIEPVLTRYVTLETWNARGMEERLCLLQATSSGKTFNKQEEKGEESIGNIEWAKWSWNPVSGCKHDCPYCYARDIADRFYEQGFIPTLYPDRLTAPRNTRVPSGANTDLSLKNVFTCSMADLFGRWVPAEWIEAVLDQVRANPQWNFLFLTKFPQRLAEFHFPNNAWLGTTVDCQARVKSAEAAFCKLREEGSGGFWWLSLEPLIEPLQFTSLNLFDWVVIGGSSRSTQTPEWRPPRAWINRLEEQAWQSGCMVYEKTNLLRRIRQFPGQQDDEPQQAPAEFHYLGTSA